MIVVDTNIIAYLLIESDHTNFATKVRRRDRNWVAPELWRSEFRNLLMLYIRRDVLTVEGAITVFEKADGFLKTSPVNAARIIELAAESGCTAYDCEFVSLAERLNIPLVTSDKKLLAAFPELLQARPARL